MVDQEFPDANPLTRHTAPQRIFVPVKVFDVLDEFTAMRQRLRCRNVLKVATGEVRCQQNVVLSVGTAMQASPSS